MAIFYRRMLDRAGRVLHDERLERSDLRAAMADANMLLRNAVGRKLFGQLDPRGRVEIADSNGRPMARINCAEMIAAIT